MNYFTIDNNTDFDFNKIILGKPITINSELTKIYIYYLDDKPKEIFIKIPNIRLINSYKNLKYNQIKLPIYPLWENTIKFIKLIKKIEKYIRLNINLENSIFVNSIEKYNNISTLKLNINQDIKVNSTISTSLSELKINGEIEGFLTMSYVWIKKNSYGLSLSCFQLKYYPRIEEYNYDFFDDPIVVSNTKKEPIKNTPENTLTIKPMLLSSSILNEAIIKLNKLTLNKC